MGTLEMPRIGHRDDALVLLEQLIEIARTSIEADNTLIVGLEALKDAIVQWVI